MSLAIRAPLAGTVVMLDDVPDPVFANRIIGPGLAIDPDRSHGTATATAPISGILSKVHPHAYVTVSPEGRSVLVHLGLDTVELGGRGFTVHAVAGSEVLHHFDSGGVGAVAVIGYSMTAEDAGGD